MGAVETCLRHLSLPNTSRRNQQQAPRDTERGETCQGCLRCPRSNFPWGQLWLCTVICFRVMRYYEDSLDVSLHCLKLRRRSDRSLSEAITSGDICGKHLWVRYGLWGEHMIFNFNWTNVWDSKASPGWLSKSHRFKSLNKNLTAPSFPRKERAAEVGYMRYLVNSLLNDILLIL